MKKEKLYILLALAVFFFTAFLYASKSKEVFFMEEFNDLENWDAIVNEKIDKPSRYTIVSENEETFLKLESHSSASAINYKGDFNVYEYPYIRWRWKVENIYKKGNAAEKKGDDYAIRIYIVFKFDSGKAGFLKKLKHRAAGLFYDGEIPDSALNYIWANKKHDRKILTNPFRKESQMILKNIS